MLVIRPATHSDLPAIMSLTRRVIAHLDAQGINQWDAYYPAQDDYEADLAKATLHAGLDEDSLVGCVCLDPAELDGYETVSQGRGIGAPRMRSKAVDSQRRIGVRRYVQALV